MPADSACRLTPLMTHGPFSLNTTGVPDLLVPTSVTEVPACRMTGAAIDHGAVVGGSTTMVSTARAPCTLTTCDETPLYFKSPLVNATAIV